MSLITQCPACGTLFKVVADQLKISEGWVRCGQCHEVFDANAQLTSAAQARAIATSATTATAVAAAHQDATANHPNPAIPRTPSATKKVAAHVTSMLGNKAFMNDDWINTVNPPAPKRPAEEIHSELPELDSPPSAFPDDVLQEHAAAHAAHAAAQSPSIDLLLSAPAPLDQHKRKSKPNKPMPTPEFVRQARRQARWRSPWARAGLGLLGLGLLAALAGQVAVHERSRLSATFPESRPTLKALCQILDCKIAPLQQIESIVVDASAFNKLKSSPTQDAYRLNITLKNTARIPVALPHIELSLNDSQDIALIRRVLNPADLGASTQVMTASGDFSGSVSIQIDNGKLGSARIAGYRVVAFYP